MVEVIKTTEHKDGSATIELELTQEEINTFVELGVNQALRDYINKKEDEKNVSNPNSNVEGE